MPHNNPPLAGKYDRSGDLLEDQVSLGELFDTLFGGWTYIAIGMVIFSFAGFFHGQLATPIYKADGLFQVEDSAPSIPGLDDMSGFFGVESSSMAEIQIIKSRMVIGKVVDDLGLTVKVQPYRLPVIGEPLARLHSKSIFLSKILGPSYGLGSGEVEIDYFEAGGSLLYEEFTLLAQGSGQYSLWLFGDKLLTGTVGEMALDEKSGVAILVTKLIVPEGAKFHVFNKSRAQTIISLQSNLKVMEKGKDTGIIQVSLEGGNSQQITEIVDSVLVNYSYQNIQRMAAEAESSLAFLDKQIPRVGAELVLAEEALNAYKVERASIDLSLETRAALDSLGQVEAEISTMAIKEADISRNFTVNHPNYVAFKMQQKNLLAQRERRRVKLDKLPGTQQKILTLMRDFEVNQAIYIALKNRRQELSVVKAGTVGNVRVLDRAQMLPKPVSPKKGMLFFLYFMVGSLISVMLVFLKSAIKPGVSDPRVFDELGLPVHAIIPLSDIEVKFSKDKLIRGQRFDNGDEYILATRYPADITIEALRNLRTALHFSMIEAFNNVVMISSANPSAGKSFISTNLAVLMSVTADKRVLLVDADMRRGCVHERFGLSAGKGLSGVLMGEYTFEQSVHKYSSGLDVLFRGKNPSNPAELLIGSNFSRLIERLGEDYDLVILDTPPVLAVTDPVIIGKHAGTCLLLARFELCSQKQIINAFTRLNLGGVNVNGVVFNAVKRKTQRYYDYGYYSYDYNDKI